MNIDICDLNSLFKTKLFSVYITQHLLNILILLGCTIKNSHNLKRETECEEKKANWDRQRKKKFVTTYYCSFTYMYVVPWLILQKIILVHYDSSIVANFLIDAGFWKKSWRHQNTYKIVENSIPLLPKWRRIPFL